jgi:cytochrome P450
MGTANRLRRDPLGCLQEFVTEAGPAVRYQFFAHMWGYLFVHPEHYQYILQDHYKNFTKMPSPAFQLLLPLVGKGLLSNDGESWLRQRRLAQPAFHRGQIQELAQVMTTTAERRLVRWEEMAHSGKVVSFDREMMELTLEIAGKALFSVDLTGPAREVGDIFNRLNELFAKLVVSPLALVTMRIPFWPSTRQVAHDVAALDQLIYGMINERRESGTPGNDLMGMLLAARDQETGEGMDEKQLRDEVITLLIAGHETTTLLLTWFFYCLGRYPEIEAQVHEEVDRTLSGRLPTFEDIPNLVYTRQVIDETLRLYPPAYALSRFGNRADSVGGYDVRANAAISLCPFITHRMPEFWRQPLEFDPERFDPAQNTNRHRFAYVPFGAGPRQCIGESFSLTEGVLVAAAIAQRFRLRIPDHHVAQLDPQITLHPKGGMPLRFEHR